jgi:hypothetical protein
MHLQLALQLVQEWEQLMVLMWELMLVQTKVMVKEQQMV